MTIHHTPGPWAWFGDPTSSESIYLATKHGGRKLVMDFVRLKMQSAQPRFESGGIMVAASELCKFQVGDDYVTGIAEAKQNRSVYRYDIEYIDNPDARLIAASPELLERLEEMVCLTDVAFTPSKETTDMMVESRRKCIELIFKIRNG